jgi:pantothenate kinase
MTSDQQKQQQQQRYITRWMKLLNGTQNSLTASMHHYTYYFHLVLFLSS